MNKKERKLWIDGQTDKFNVNKVGKLLHAHHLYVDATQSYIHGLSYATILCIEAAINSLLSQKLGKIPSLKESAKRKKEKNRLPTDYRMPSTRELIREVNFIGDELKKDISNFIEIRHKVEHPKTQLDPLFMDWKYEGETLHSYEPDEKLKSEIFSLNSLSHAKMGLEVYFKLCDSIYKSLVSPNSI